MLEFRKAKRKAAPMLLAISSVSGGGKTYTSLLLAAGIAGPDGRVGMVDAENGRGEMYADSPGIMAALPNGYDYIRFDPPYSPDRYIEHLQAAEKAGITVCVVDSGSHEWEGIGGCCEIAEKNPLGKMPNWSRAKLAHKRFVNYLLSSSMHIIFCLRAREKVKIFKRGDQMVTNVAAVGEDFPIADKDTVVSLGLQPITEKGFIFEMLVSLQLDEHTHFAVPLKVPEPLMPLFPGKRLITKEDGERIRRWNLGAPEEDPAERLQKRAHAAAEEGVESYRAFFTSLTAAQKQALKPHHEANKATAEQADKAIPTFGSEHNHVEWPDSFDGPTLRWNGELYEFNDESGNYKKVEVAHA